jgi:hypothetical protein
VNLNSTLRKNHQVRFSHLVPEKTRGSFDSALALLGKELPQTMKPAEFHEFDSTPPLSGAEGIAI